MSYFGCHLSPSKGYYHMGQTAQSIGAKTFQFFTRNPRGGKAKELDTKDAQALVAYLQGENFGPLVAHAPYTVNAASQDERISEFAKLVFLEDLKRMEYFPGNYYNFHPGSHVGQGTQQGIENIVKTLDTALYEGMQTTVLLETMAGKGTEIGRTFEELRMIMDTAKLGHLLGVCMDTCHVWDAGYDIVENLDAVLEEFDTVIGLGRLKALHINDSLNPLGAHKDRHACLGAGYMGEKVFQNIVNHPALKDLPMILETPNELDGYQKEITWLKEQIHE